MSGERADADPDDDPDDDLDDDLDREPVPPRRPAARGPARAASPARSARSHRRRVLAVAGTAAGLAAAALGVGSLAGRAADEGRPLFSGPATAEGLFPVLDQEASPGTGYPGTTLVTSLGVDPASPRRIATTSAADFWVARTDEGGVCLLARDTDEAAGLGGICGTAAEASRGLQLPAGRGATAVLLPAAAAADGSDAAEQLVEGGFVRAADALWVDGETARRTLEDLVDGASDRSVVVPSAAREGSSALPVFLTQSDVTHAVVLACLQPVAVEVTVARGASQPVECGRDAAFVRFEGRGGPVRVDVSTPDGLLWAAGVVRCSSSLQGPLC